MRSCLGGLAALLALAVCASAGFSSSNGTVGGYVVKIKRRPSGHLESRDADDTHVFDPTYAVCSLVLLQDDTLIRLA